MKSIALDLGCSEFRSIRQDGQRLIARRVPAVYCSVPDNPSNRKLLEQARIPFSFAQGALVIIGNAAEELAGLIHCPVLPVMMEGHFPWDDPVGRQVCSVLIESIVPIAKDATCTATLPHSMMRKPAEQLNVIEKLLSLRGYQTTFLKPASALALAELQESEFSGIGIVLGSESISISITRYGTPVLETVFGQGFRTIEQRFAKSRHRYLWDQRGNRYLDLHSVRKWLQETDISLESPDSGDELWLVKQFHQLLSDAWASVLPDLIRVSQTSQLQRRLPVVYSGGPTHMNGFPEFLSHVMRKSHMPFRIQELRSSIFGPYSVARGLLVHSTLNSLSRRSAPPKAA